MQAAYRAERAALFGDGLWISLPDQLSDLLKLDLVGSSSKSLGDCTITPAMQGGVPATHETAQMPRPSLGTPTLLLSLYRAIGM